MRLHPWHEIPLGDNTPDEVNLVVEIPRRTTTKYEIEWFFEDYQDVMHRQVDVEGFLGTEHAHESIQKCREQYKKTFPDGRQG